MAVIKADIQVELRAIKLSNKPTEMLDASPKGTVPVLVLPQRLKEQPMVIEESLDIMLWALAQNDPHRLLPLKQHLPEMIDRIVRFESEFVPALDSYKQAKRYHEDSLIETRLRCESILAPLESRLKDSPFLCGEREQLLDIALVTLIRKFTRVERAWFRQSQYVGIQRWLNHYIQSPLFSLTMRHVELWLPKKQAVMFGAKKPT